MIEVSNLTKQLGNNKVLQGLSFSIPANCIAGLLGPNGAGKTTTIKVLSTLLGPTGGSVSIDGYDTVNSAFDVRKRLGYLPEDPPLYNELTVLEQLKLAGGLQGLRGEKLSKAINKAVEKCQLQEVLKTDVFKLSKGFRQRVGIAQSILHDPKVIILDEPTNGLDPIQLVQARTIIRSLAESSTVLFSSHLLQEVVEICSRVILIAEGKKLFEAELEQSSSGQTSSRQELERRFIEAVQGVSAQTNTPQGASA